MSRHHKANDFMFAILLPEVYARRYLEFRPEDCDKLCEKCHKYWHKKVKPLVTVILRQARNPKIVTEKWCEKRRAEILSLYESWINSKKVVKNGKRSKKKRNRKSSRSIRRSSNAS